MTVRGLAGAAAVDELAGEAAQRALELRGLTAKGARLRKKKALTDLLEALQAAGASRHASAVPVDDRSVHAWFAQVWAHQDGICFGWLARCPQVDILLI